MRAYGVVISFYFLLGTVFYILYDKGKQNVDALDSVLNKRCKKIQISKFSDGRCTEIENVSVQNGVAQVCDIVSVVVLENNDFGF